MLAYIYFTWLAGMVGMLLGSYVCSLPAVDVRIGGFLNQHTRLFSTRYERKRLYDWIFVFLFFAWILLFLYIFARYLTGSPFTEYA